MVPLPPLKAPTVRVPTGIPSRRGKAVEVDYEIHSGTDSEDMKSEVASDAGDVPAVEEHTTPPAAADSGGYPAGQPQGAAPTRVEPLGAAPDTGAERPADVPALPEEQFAYSERGGSSLLIPSAWQ